MRLFAYVTENSGWKKKYKKLSNKICERPHHKKNSCRNFFEDKICSYHPVAFQSS